MRFTAVSLSLIALAIGIVGWSKLTEASLAKPGQDAEELMTQAILASEKEDWLEADSILTKLLATDDPPPVSWYMRGRARFCLGKVKDSAKDFDQYYERVPSARSRQWERGIALYYAGRYEDGAKQFELYQTYHDSDVENATWKYLCEARTLGAEAARQRILEIGPDRRVPMRAIYDLYAGNATVDEVFETVKKAELDDASEKQALFYAHLYVGLWHESRGENEQARPHLKKAGTELPIDHYMGWVGRVHWKLLGEKAPN